MLTQEHIRQASQSIRTARAALSNVRTSVAPDGDWPTEQCSDLYNAAYDALLNIESHMAVLAKYKARGVD